MVQRVRDFVDTNRIDFEFSGFWLSGFWGARIFGFGILGATPLYFLLELTDVGRVWFKDLESSFLTFRLSSCIYFQNVLNENVKN